MGKKTKKNIEGFGSMIQKRRKSLGLTMEEAAELAGVAISTWYRYEVGQSVSEDKLNGICKALNWTCVPSNADDEPNGYIPTPELFQHDPAWSPNLAGYYGEKAAMAFVLGSDHVLSSIRQDMAALASMPAGSHLGQLGCSFLEEDLPEEFLMKYDYSFLYRMESSLLELIARLKHGGTMDAQTPMEELLLYLILDAAKSCFEVFGIEWSDDSCRSEESEEDEDFPRGCFEEWENDILEDTDIMCLKLLAGVHHLSENDHHHFNHWFDPFYTYPDSEEEHPETVTEAS